MHRLVGGLSPSDHTIRGGRAYLNHVADCIGFGKVDKRVFVRKGNKNVDASVQVNVFTRLLVWPFCKGSVPVMSMFDSAVVTS